MLCLYVQAPFAVFRTFSAGSFRPTADFITPSAAYGLLLNIAGIEMREYSDQHVMTLIRQEQNLPSFRLALGAITFPRKHSVYQQLHNYPVGSSGIAHAWRAKGNKYNITPVRRSFLSDIRAYICISGNQDFEGQVVDGLERKTNRAYGLPFLGDNNFLPDRIESVEKWEAAHWYIPILQDTDHGLYKRITRMTIQIDRADLSRTKTALFAPTNEATREIPDEAWVEVGY
ncbi:MAG TPA: CRISPR-associated protein Cas5 [bacterium]|nr:CRISPR-associated protein Cas5 [bacterium]